MGQGVPLVDGHSVRDTVARVEHDASGAARGVEGQHGLDGHVHGWGVEGLKHDLGHLLTVGLGVEGSLSQQHWVLLRGHTQLVVEGVMPDLQEKEKREGQICNAKMGRFLQPILCSAS